MFEHSPQEPTRDGPMGNEPPPDRDREGGLRAPPEYSPLRKFWWWFHFLILVKLARLRFIAVVVAIGAVIVYWDTLNNYYEKWFRTEGGQQASGTHEWFCPMHPQIVRDNPKDKCPICFMNLSRRAKGTGKPEPLPAGTVSRVQLSPYRIVLAGVSLWEVKPVALSKQLVTAGFVEFDETKRRHIAARLKGRIDKLHADYTGKFVKRDESLALLNVRYNPELFETLQNLVRAEETNDENLLRLHRERLRRWDITAEQLQQMKDALRAGKNPELIVTSPIKGHVIKKYQVEGNYVDEGSPLYDVADLDTVWIEAEVYEADRSLLSIAQQVEATIESLPNRPFSGEVSFIYPHLDQSTRTVRVRFSLPNSKHELAPGMYATVTLTVPPRHIEALAKSDDLNAEQLALLEKGEMLAVPESAVIDTGNRKIVYRETAPKSGIYDGIEVRLGTRMEGPDNAAFYPVLRGLKPGDQIVTAGSFLIDAETRLNPAAGSIYFGGSGGRSTTATVAVRPSTPEEEDAKLQKAKQGLAKLDPKERELAQAQKFCPIEQNNLLGEMGKPFKIQLDGQTVYLCCSSCEDRAKENKQQTLETVKRLKEKAKSKSPQPPTPPATPGAEAEKEQAKIKANLAKLNAEDRKLAEAQRICPIQDKPLGSMGKPFEVKVKGERVFLCCQSCEEDALAEPEKTLAKVKELKEKAKAPPPKP